MNILLNIGLLDTKISENIIHLRTDFLNNFFITFTMLGVWYVILFLFICVSAIFYFYKKTNLILPFFIILIGSGVLTVIIKFLVDRARPSLDLAIYAEKLPAFPSAHAALILAFFGFLIYCLWKFSFGLKIKIILTLLSILLIALVGFSRVYLGVHYLSDVIVGYLVGLMWLLITLRFF